MFMCDSEPLVRIVVTTKIVHLLQGTVDIVWMIYSGECLRAIFLIFLVILQTSKYVQKSILMKGSTSFLHKYDVCQNKHQTGSKEIVCLFPANMLPYLTGQLVVDVTSFTCFGALMLHHALHMNRTTGGLLFFCDVTLGNLGFITNYSIPKSSLKSLYRFLFFSVSSSWWYSFVRSSWCSYFFWKIFLTISV